MSRTGTTTQRQYGARHQAERKRLIPIVRREGAECAALICLMPDRTMPPGTEPHEWDLGHNEDRTGWTGPEHTKCNRTEGAIRGNKLRRQQPPPDANRWVL